jgi:hypothetical protein
MRKKLERSGAGKCNMLVGKTWDLLASRTAVDHAVWSGPSARKLRAPQDDIRLGHHTWVRDCKERGEWAELCFMAKAAGMGMLVSKPLDDSCRYDVLVEAGGRILRVQVKSTIYRRREGEYSLNVMGPGRKRYKKGTVDFFAVYLIPVDEWYIIPYKALRKTLTLHFRSVGGRQKYRRYREAWHLLSGGKVPIEIQACAGEEWGDVPVEVGRENLRSMTE